jgi:hypothetical protein
MTIHLKYWKGPTGSLPGGSIWRVGVVDKRTLRRAVGVGQSHMDFE